MLTIWKNINKSIFSPKLISAFRNHSHHHTPISHFSIPTQPCTGWSYLLCWARPRPLVLDSQSPLTEARTALAQMRALSAEPIPQASPAILFRSMPSQPTSSSSQTVAAWMVLRVPVRHLDPHIVTPHD
jgi:hypothetical protein